MSTVVKIALPILADLKARDAAHEQDVAEWARQGYRPHHCKHGTNLWVEWDVMCPGCEDSLTVYAEALSIAHGRLAECKVRTEMMTAMLTAALPYPRTLPADLVNQIIDWAMEPVR